MKNNFVELRKKRGEKLYHMSSNKFNFPDWDYIDKDIGEKRILGLWTTQVANIDGFGNYCYEIEMKEDARIMGLELAYLYKFHCEDTDEDPLIRYRNLRKTWQSEADVVYLLDGNPEISEIIIINFDKILKFELNDCAKRHTFLKKA